MYHHHYHNHHLIIIINIIITFFLLAFFSNVKSGIDIQFRVFPQETFLFSSLLLSCAYRKSMMSLAAFLGRSNTTE